MLRYARSVILGVAICAVLGAMGPSAVAGTILKLNLAGVSPDIQYAGSPTPIFSTVDDGNAATTGNQDTAIEFTDFLDSVETDIVSPPGSFSMSGLTPSGAAMIFNSSLVLQNFVGGSFSLYDESNVLLLSGTLDNSSLTGALGQSVGALFTTSFSTVTGGTLQSHIAPDSLVLSMNFTNVASASGGGFSVSNIVPVSTFVSEGTLNPFTGDASVNLEAQIPEPGSFALVLVGGLLIGAARRRASCS